MVRDRLGGSERVNLEMDCNIVMTDFGDTLEVFNLA